MHLQDEIEKHHKARDKLPLDIHDDVALSDDSLDEDEVRGGSSVGCLLRCLLAAALPACIARLLLFSGSCCRMVPLLR